MIVGKRINDRYKILELIGGGGMSNVYLAQDMILNREVAIKILRYDFSNEENLHRRFQREVLSATSLAHPNIVSVYDVGDDGEMHYIVMEYIKGKTLKQYIQEFSPLSPARSTHIMKQLTSAITHAHDNGIIHRDIKPQNILVDQDGNVKITDFGIATTLGATSYTQTNSVIGTVHYLSPEQARGGMATKASDIYALGIVLYELLTGQLPFSGESAVSIALKHLQTETPSVRAFDATIPQSVENIVNKATAKNAAHRYETADEMEADLETCLSIDRIHEEKFQVPVDDEQTKLIPIIKDPKPVVTTVSPKVEESKPPQKEQQEKSTPVKRKKKWATIFGALAVLAILAIIIVNMLSPKKIEIPDVSGMTVVEATETLEKAGFSVGETDERNSEEIEAERLIGTTPEAGIDRLKGTTIDLIVSIGPESAMMLDYKDSKIDQVRPMLVAQGFTVDVVDDFFDAEAGTIIGQSPEAGTEIIVKDTTITFTVSKGKKLISVTDLKGFNQAALTDYQRTSGFKIDKSEVTSDTVTAGNVISQEPKAGEPLEKGGTIKVVISKGPAEKVVKFFSVPVLIPYEPEVEGMEQTVLIYIQDKNTTMADPVDELVIFEPTNYTIELEIAEGEKATYRIVRDSKVIINEMKAYDDLVAE